jgi:IS5 family transposase
MEAEGPQAKAVLADRGYDSDHIRETLEENGVAAVIPTRRNRPRIPCPPAPLKLPLSRR